MSEAQVPLVRTPIAPLLYAGALLRAWRLEYGILPGKAQAGVLWSQYMVETGGKACWNFNIGNVKHVTGDGYDWFDLPGTWEIVNGQRIVLPDGNPGRRFRAYVDLASAMTHHLKFLRNKRYAPSWPMVEAGDAEGFAYALRKQGYYTAPAEDYARLMRAFHKQWMESSYFEDAQAQLLESLEAITEPDLPSLADDDEEPESPPIIRRNDDIVAEGIKDYQQRRDRERGDE